MTNKFPDSQAESNSPRSTPSRSKGQACEIAEPSNLGELLHYSATRIPQKPALICGDRVVSYEALDLSSDALARFLLRKGLDSGDRVAIHWSNSAELVNLYFACFKAGLVAVPINIRLKGPELAYVLQQSSARVCFSQPEFAPVCERVHGDCPHLEHTYSVLPTLKTTESDVALPDVASSRIAAILYRSGITARPKGVIHTHASLMASSSLMSSLGLDETDVLLAPTQMVHIGAIGGALLTGLYRGGRSFYFLRSMPFSAWI